MFIKRRPFSLLLLAVFTAAACRAYADPSKITHLDLAKTLVGEIQPDKTGYRHKNGFVKWKGYSGADDFESRTDCSGFVTALLEQAYCLTPGYFEEWLGKRRPHAKDYHEAIMSQNGFRTVSLITEVEPGDFIAVRYPDGTGNTGHIMIVAEAPKSRKATKPVINGLDQWEVAVIDSSISGHGKTDTRYRKDGTFGSGAGRGILRLYTDRNGYVAGYTWSTFGNSEYYDQTARSIAIGRLDPP
jgi:hypothetical protein